MTRTTIAKLGGNYLVTFAQALKELYKKDTEIECFRIKGWFMLKNEDKFETEAGELDSNLVRMISSKKLQRLIKLSYML